MTLKLIGDEELLLVGGGWKRSWQLKREAAGAGTESRRDLGVGILVLLAGSATSGRTLNLSVPQFPPCKMRKLTLFSVKRVEIYEGKVLCGSNRS